MAQGDVLVKRTFPLRDALNLIDKKPSTEGIKKLVSFLTHKSPSKLNFIDYQNCCECLMKQEGSKFLKQYIFHFDNFKRTQNHNGSQTEWENFIQYMIGIYGDQIEVMTLLPQEDFPDECISNAITCYGEVSYD